MLLSLPAGFFLAGMDEARLSPVRLGRFWESARSPFIRRAKPLRLLRFTRMDKK